MEIICESDYQDIYRITDGVLLVINKFEYIKRNSEILYVYPSSGKRIWKQYMKGCQNHLKELIVDCKIINDNYVIPKGTVLYHSRPVQKVSCDKWQYQIKTTGDMFSGTAKNVLNYMEVIKEIIESK